ncbi:MAG: methionine--tRNA ligase [Longimicrobiales bacterium]
MSESSKNYYITTAIDYANGLPHLGHALEKVGADAVARYRRGRGGNVHFVIGMDEHGQNVLQSAQESGITPNEWVDGIAEHFRDAWRTLSISHDDFIRTTQDRHHRAVREMVRRLEASGDLYTDTYSGYYCVRCEAYKTEDELVPAGDGEDGSGQAGATGEDGPADGDSREGLRCPLHPSREIQWMEEENWFFRLSRYRDPLLELLEERPDFILPEIRRNEILRVLEGGLDDISVSRSRLPWGVPWPDDQEQTVYVWLDALTNYLSAIGFPDEGYEEFWPADVHVIGKDITRFHCIYWPAFLMSAGLPLPKLVWVHGFVTYGGRKMSKSEGVTFDLDEAVERHGPEALRYYLLREVPWNGDGDITRERFDERYTAELANDLGNLASRVLAMIERYRDGVIPAGTPTELRDRGRLAVEEYRAVMDEHLLHKGIEVARGLTSVANGFVESRAPWERSKEEKESGEESDALSATLADLAWALAVLASLNHPFLPGKMDSLAHRLGLESVPDLDALPDLDLEGNEVDRGEPLFPRPDL